MPSRTKVVHLDDLTHFRLEEYAKSVGRTMAEIVEDWIHEALKPPPPPPKVEIPLEGVRATPRARPSEPPMVKPLKRKVPE